MPCTSAVTKNLVTIGPEETVENALALLKEKQVRSLPVVDKENKLLGLFNRYILLKNLLPVSIAMAGGVNLEMSMSAAPGIVKRYRKTLPLPVESFMERKINAVAPQAPVWEGVRMLLQHGAPLLVVEEESGKLIGLINEESIIDEMNRMQDG